MDKKNIKIVFLGSADFSVPLLNFLIEEFTVSLIITEEDKAAGRGKKIVSPPTKILATTYNIPCLQPHKLKFNNELIEEIQKQEPDILVVAAYGKILPKELLNVAPGGCINVHPSLLPKYRGPSPIQTALVNGDQETGVSIIKLNERMDAGDILVQEKVDIAENDTYELLAEKLAQCSSKNLVSVIPEYLNDKVELQKQDETQATYCYMIDKLDGKIDFTQDADVIYNKYRAFHYWPNVFCFYKKLKFDLCEIKKTDLEIDVSEYLSGQVFKFEGKVYVKCGNSALELQTVQIEGKKAVSIKDFINGHQDFIGSILV